MTITYFLDLHKLVVAKHGQKDEVRSYVSLSAVRDYVSKLIAHGTQFSVEVI